jgi:hypothetical protein
LAIGVPGWLQRQFETQHMVVLTVQTRMDGCNGSSESEWVVATAVQNPNGDPNGWLQRQFRTEWNWWRSRFRGCTYAWWLLEERLRYLKSVGDLRGVGTNAHLNEIKMKMLCKKQTNVAPKKVSAESEVERQKTRSRDSAW